jgi:hypothetical protein
MFTEMLLSGLEYIVGSIHDFIFEQGQEELSFEGPREWFVKEEN